MKRVLKEMLRQRGMEDDVKRLVEAERKRVKEEREEIKLRELERCRGQGVHSECQVHKSGHRDRSPITGDMGHHWTDTDDGPSL